METNEERQSETRDERKASEHLAAAAIKLNLAVEYQRVCDLSGGWGEAAYVIAKEAAAELRAALRIMRGDV